MAWKTEQTGLRASLIILLTLLCSSHVAAEDEEYLMEFGATAGVCYYLGDANSTPYAHMSGMGGFIGRRIFNPRMALKFNLAYGHISGTSEGRFIPQDPNSQTIEGGTPVRVDFSRNLIDLGAQFELNFWGFGTGTGFKDNKRITPYMLGGIGFTLAPGGAGTRGALNLPIGLGVKYKVKPRLNIGLEMTVRFTTSDELDAGRKDAMQLVHPYGIKSVGLKNKDCYSFTMLYVTYDMCPKRRKCNNE